MAYRIIGKLTSLVGGGGTSQVGGQFGSAIVALPDIDGDGLTDLAIAAVFDNYPEGSTIGTGSVYIISSSDLLAADRGAQSIQVSALWGEPDSWRIDGAEPYGFFGVELAAGLGPDGVTLLTGASGFGSHLDPGRAYLFSLDAINAAAGPDGIASVAEVLSQTGAHVLAGTKEVPAFGTAGRGFGEHVTYGADSVGDDQADFLVSGQWDVPFTATQDQSHVYLVASSDLSGPQSELADLLEGSGESYLFTYDFGLQSNPDGTASFGLRIDPETAFIDDLDGDGKAEILIAQLRQPEADQPEDISLTEAAFIVSSGDLAALDPDDDRVIALEDIARGQNSYKIDWNDPTAQVNYGVSSLGDIDGDGRGEIALTALQAQNWSVVPDPGPGALGPAGQRSDVVYIFDGDDLSAVASSGEIDLDALHAAAGVVTISSSSTDAATQSGTDLSVTRSGPADASVSGAVLVSAAREWIDEPAGIYGDALYILPDDTLGRLAAADGTDDGVIDLANIAGVGGAYRIFASPDGGYLGAQTVAAANFDGDALGDYAIGVPQFASGDPVDGMEGAAYIVLGRKLRAADDAGDGVHDGTIFLTDTLPDFVVQGTDGDDLIDLFYTSDPTIDTLDDADAADGSNDDVVQAGDGDDTIVASKGDDDIDGGDGRDTYRAADDALMAYRLIGDRSTGYSVAQTGDMNGDGLDDLLIGARWAGISDTGAFEQYGKTYLVTGAALAQATPLAGTAGVIDLDTIAGDEGAYTFKGDTVADLSGTAIASLGDLDGDGHRELLIGAASAGVYGAGKAYLVASGSFDAADTDTDGVIDLGDVAGKGMSFQFDANAGDYLGTSIASAGDVDGDGFEDLIVGAPGWVYDPAPASAYLVTAQYLRDHRDAGGDGVIDLPDAADEAGIYRIEGAADASTGRTVAPAGNVVGDERADLMIFTRPSVQGSNVVHLVSAEALDSVGADEVMNLGDFASWEYSYSFEGFAAAFSDADTIITAAGDADGDGQTDLLIGSYLVNGAELAALDSDNDRVITPSDIQVSQESFDLSSSWFDPRATTAFVDALGDDRPELLIGLQTDQFTRSVYLVSHDDLAEAVNANRQVDLDDIVAAGSSYRFLGMGINRGGGIVVSSAGDVDGDGREDLVIGAMRAQWDEHDTIGEAYLIRSADLAHLDAADGTADGTINLDHVGMLAEQTLDVTTYDDATGTAIKSGTGYPGTDTLTSVEHYIADEGAGHDSITLNNTTAQELFDRDVAVSDLDGAIGTFDPGNGDADIAFGGPDEPTLPEILADIRDGAQGYAAGGRFTITSGDESGQVGNISFENFETIDFGIVCFAAGTLIDTPAGPRPVEQIAAGDAVLTRDRDAQPVRWSGARRVSAAAQIANPRTRPIRIRAGALGPGVPARDLRVSRQHRILLADPDTGNEVLLAAIKLVGRPGITRDDSCMALDYHHLLCPRHEILSAHGVPAESLLLGPQARKMLTPAQWAQISRDCADLVARPGPAARPIVRRAPAALTVPRSTAAKAEGLRRRTRHENPAPHFARPPVSTADVPGARETVTAPPPF